MVVEAWLAGDGCLLCVIIILSRYSFRQHKVSEITTNHAQIDGLITLPVAIYGLFLFPDTPHHTQAPYLTTAERSLAISRVPETPRLRLNLQFLLKVLSSWQWYGFVTLWVIAGETESFSSNSLISLWLQREGGYSVSQLNNYATGVPAVGIISTLFWATLTDFYGGERYLVAYFIAVLGIVTSVLILVDGEKRRVSFVAYYLAGSVYACQAYVPLSLPSPLILSSPQLLNQKKHLLRMGQRRSPLRRRDFPRRRPRKYEYVQQRCQRMVVHCLLPCVLSPLFHRMSPPHSPLPSLQIFIPQLLTKEEKKKRGMWAMIATCIALALWTSGLLWVSVRAEKKLASIDGEEEVVGESKVQVEGKC